MGLQLCQGIKHIPTVFEHAVQKIEEYRCNKLEYYGTQKIKHLIYLIPFNCNDCGLHLTKT